MTPQQPAVLGQLHGATARTDGVLRGPGQLSDGSRTRPTRRTSMAEHQFGFRTRALHAGGTPDA